MKAIGCVAVVAVLAVGGFFALAAWLITRGDDQSALTKQVEVTVINPHDVGTGLDRGYRFEYAYRVDGQWYGDDYFINDNYWKPGEPATVCIDPENPRHHVVSMFKPCGEKWISGGFIEDATPRPAPEPQP